MNYKKYAIALLALCCTEGAFSQSLTQARRYFDKGNYEKAKPIYKQLVRRSRSNASLNYYYGVCCFETGNIVESIPYLEKSTERKFINGYLYLSKAYANQYRFDEAIENLEQHIYWLDRKKRKTEQAEALMTELKKGANMIRGVKDVTVIDSIVVDKQNFLEAYRLSPEAGHLSMAKDSACTAHTNEMSDKSFYAQRNAAGNSSLYASIKMIDKWSNPALQKGLNDNLNQLNYPFMLSDGSTFYFAAQGEGSIGGYDIFITRTDSEENTFLKPDNMGYPFNSPANDYMYCIDEYKNLGWFASDRYQPEDKVCIYVFVPNEQGTVLDYETTDSERLRAVARLSSIAATQTNTQVVSSAKERLAQLNQLDKGGKKKKNAFSFIINDQFTYYSLKDFRGREAKERFQVLLQQENDFDMLVSELNLMRSAYISGDSSNKEILSPEIKDKELRVEQMRDELAKLRTEVRNLELKALGK